MTDERAMKKHKQLGKTRRFPIPPAQPHKDHKNDHQRHPKHRGRQ